MERVRYLNKQVNSNERKNFSGWWKEQININGMLVVYYSDLTTVSSSNPLYGENTAAGFTSGDLLTSLFLLNQDAMTLSKFGLSIDSDLNGVIHPETFTEIFGASAEPKAGDLMKLSEYGVDRINFPKRGDTVYQLTEVIDEFKTNALGGHYVWFFQAKRYDFSHEETTTSVPGVSSEAGPWVGAGVGNTPLDDNDIINQISLKNFNYDTDNVCSNNSVYGEY